MKKQILNVQHGIRLLLLLTILWPITSTVAHTVTTTPVLPAWFEALENQSAGPIIDPDLQHILESGSEEPLRIIAVLRTDKQVNLQPRPDKKDLVSMRSDTIESLQTNLANASVHLDPLLANAQASGELLARQDLWIVGGMALTVKPALVQQLLNAPEITELRLDQYHQYVDPQELSGPESNSTHALTWGVSQVRAPETWNTLGITGSGAVVAIMDSGVDWIHPALAAQYRGKIAREAFDHTYSWYDPINNGLYPYDDFGHGTHVAGTTLGNGNIGVAPGARWIGVKVLGSNGNGYDSWIHAGFQWMLAPGGDPAMAPDVVNASWSSPNSYLDTFKDDIDLLTDLGVFVVFAAGNSGPEPESIGSPASNPGVFAVAAHDAELDIANFSGRGPTPWKEIKPHISAPGVAVLSAIPGGIYAYSNGTSMAAPHIAGIGALMRAASPTISVDMMRHILTSTAVPLSSTYPNNDSGWGYVDAYAAVAATLQAGTIYGTMHSSIFTEIPGATITAQPHGPSVGTGQSTSDHSGEYSLALRDGFYDLVATAFGYAAQTKPGVEVRYQTQQRVDFELQALPTGTLRGQVSISGSTTAPTRTVHISVLNTPVSTTSDSGGNYEINLPAGTYSVEVRGLGYRVLSSTFSITAGSNTIRDFTLIPIPTLLLVDDGAWHYGSQITYWRAALDMLAYTYDEINIKSTSSDVPISSTLSAYDVVLWSSPDNSPGTSRGSIALEDYLQGGGHLLVSGQDIAYLDGGDFPYYNPQDYLVSSMSVRYKQDIAPSRSLIGQGPFEGLNITIEGSGGADNQLYPDEIEVRDLDIAAPVWSYTDGQEGGVAAYQCIPYRSLFFSFGYEGINDASSRQEIMRRSIEWLMHPNYNGGLHFKDGTRTVIGEPGTQATHTLLLRNAKYGEPAENINVTAAGNQWATQITPQNTSLAACRWLTLTVVVDIPATSGKNAKDNVIIYITPDGGDPLSVTLHTKTPAPILLVDDDRWYPMEEHYKTALAAYDLPFDVWDTEHNKDGLVVDTSPPLEIIQRYPIVIWFTGYDWYAPLLPEEITRLEEYLNNGGRLLLSSQEFLYHHNDSTLPSRLGVYAWSEAQTTTTAYGVPEHPASGLWGAIDLEYPFKNWSDIIEPQANAATVMREAGGQPIAIANQLPESNHARSLLYGFPLETLPDIPRARVLRRAVGWLSPLGKSSWVITPTAPETGALASNTLTLYNDAPTDLDVNFEHLLPKAFTLEEATLPAELHYSSSTHSISWTGKVSPHTPRTFTWMTTISATARERITPTVSIAIPMWKLKFTREAYLQVAGADLAGSHWKFSPNQVIWGSTPTTLSFGLHNSGPGALDMGELHVWVMSGLSPLSETLRTSRGWGANLWSGTLGPGESKTISLPVQAWMLNKSLRVDALLKDNRGFVLERSRWVNIQPLSVYLPLTLKSH